MFRVEWSLTHSFKNKIELEQGYNSLRNEYYNVVTLLDKHYSLILALENMISNQIEEKTSFTL